MHPLRFAISTGLALVLSLTGCHKAAEDTSTAPGVADAAVQETAAGSGGAMWGANYFPNIPLTTHRGEKVRFFDDLLKDKVVAVNFIYTKCADACPMETARLLEVQRLLGDRLGKDIFFYSISIDPEHDTPEVLSAYAKNWKTGPGWTFLTGKDEDITALRKKLGVYEADRKKKDHGLSMVIGNQKTGRWMKRSPYENPYVLATQLGSWLHNWKLPVAKDHDYENAPAVRNISAGEEMFRARCSSCHTVGGGDKNEVDDRRVGPDLFNVTKQRDRAWLERWLMHPDQMLAEKDPIATKLFEAYRGITMPNLRLDKNEVTNLLSYLDEESQAVERRADAARNSALDAASEAAKANAARAANMAPIGPLPEAALPSAREALTSYDAMRAAFAADDLAGAQARVGAIADAVTKAADRAGPAKQALLDLANAARAVGSAKDIEAGRAAFGDLSRLTVALATGTPQLRQGWHLFRCPMATGYQKWIQASPALNNPYWGKRMLTCGRELDEWAI